MESTIPEATLCFEICSPAVLIVGKTGAGKSTLGNMLLNLPPDSGPFRTSNSFDSVSQECETYGILMGDQHLNVVDTPGIFDTKCTDETTLAKIGKVLNYCSYGVQAILLVIEAGRYTAEQEEMVRKIEEYFGSESLSHTIVIFTKCNKEQTVDSSGMLNWFNDKLRSLIDAISGRWAIAPNPDLFDEHDDVYVRHISQIRLKILQMTSVYTTDLFQRVRAARESEARQKEEDRARAAQLEEERVKSAALDAQQSHVAEERRRRKNEIRTMNQEHLNQINAQNGQLQSQAEQQNAQIQEMQRKIDNGGN